jgi:IS5 family transposase
LTAKPGTVPGFVLCGKALRKTTARVAAFSQPGVRKALSSPTWRRRRAHLTGFHGISAPNAHQHAQVTPRVRGKEAAADARADQRTPEARRRSMTWAQRLQRVFHIRLAEQVTLKQFSLGSATSRVAACQSGRRAICGSRKLGVRKRKVSAGKPCCSAKLARAGTKSNRLLAPLAGLASRLYAFLRHEFAKVRYGGIVK